MVDGLIEGPSPFESTETWRDYLAGLRTLPDPGPIVRSAIHTAEITIAAKEAEDSGSRPTPSAA